MSPTAADVPAPIDLDHLALFDGGDLSLRAEIFGLFREQVDLWLRALTADADASVWTSAAHTLKGSARGIGAHALGDACARAEELDAAAASVAVKAALAADVRAAAYAALDFIDRIETPAQRLARTLAA